MTATTASPAVQSNPRAGLETDSNAPPRARTQVTGARAREITSKVAGGTAVQVRRFTGTGMLDATPATVHQVWKYTRAGGWVPGKRARRIEFFGKLYGYLIAVPVTALAFIALWFVQRPTRVVFGVILWFALGWAL